MLIMMSHWHYHWWAAIESTSTSNTSVSLNWYESRYWDFYHQNCWLFNMNFLTSSKHRHITNIMGKTSKNFADSFFTEAVTTEYGILEIFVCIAKFWRWHQFKSIKRFYIYYSLFIHPKYFLQGHGLLDTQLEDPWIIMIDNEN